jgi:hypothetical protein
MGQKLTFMERGFILDGKTTTTTTTTTKSSTLSEENAFHSN